MGDQELELRWLLLAWWQANGRHSIPWKRGAIGARPEPGEPLDSYPIWVAEVMLQQTQLQVVLPYWQRWMQAFPSVEALAVAQEHDVLLLWQGLGYYSRARRLHQGARQLVGGSSEVAADAVPYTHLTLPTISRVSVTGCSGSRHIQTTEYVRYRMQSLNYDKSTQCGD